ncbi:uncharacterized protein LOC126665404 [Mercurialis annua]|uniref:uncharacterized protein LOC126665404 n=1 Tax=Mercurialis annua TaxID=3986 RepID=UPI00215E616D|nr:uncharacterized protein LOC126665404 [Mercurialis annua]
MYTDNKPLMSVETPKFKKWLAKEFQSEKSFIEKLVDEKLPSNIGDVEDGEWNNGVKADEGAGGSIIRSAIAAGVPILPAVEMIVIADLNQGVHGGEEEEAAADEQGADGGEEEEEEAADEQGYNGDDDGEDEEDGDGDGDGDGNAAVNGYCCGTDFYYALPVMAVAAILTVVFATFMIKYGMQHRKDDN